MTRRGVVIHLDDARPHVSLATKPKLRELEYLPYGADFVSIPTKLFLLVLL